MSGSEARAGPEPVPAGVGLLLVLSLGAAALCWNPMGFVLRSDDWLALHWASKPAQVLHDFAGPQYGMQRLALFLRPMITASFALDYLAGGVRDTIPLAQNLAVHLADGLLLFALLRRLVRPAAAWAAATAWLLQPGHSEAVLWGVGRVDTHGTFFFLLALVLDRRGRERGRAWSPAALAAFVAGALTKESCLVLPAAVALLDLALEPKRPLAARCARLAPWCWVLALLLLWRLAALGTVLGGYAEARPAFDFLADLPRVFTPATGALATLFSAAAAIAFAFGFPRAGRRRLAALLVLGLLTALPSAGAKGGPDAPALPRYRYLPAAPLLAAAALSGPLPPLLLAAAALPGIARERAELREAAARVRAGRARIERLLAEHRGPEPVLVDLPSGRAGRPLFHVGLDRLAVPPFHRPPRRILPARWLYRPPAGAAPAAAGARALPVLYEGPKPLGLEGLARVTRGARARIALAGVRAVRWWVEFETALGRFAAALPAASDGSLPVKALLLARPLGAPATQTVVFALWPGAEIGLRPEPLCRLAALDARGRVLARSRQPFPLPLARDVGRFLRPVPAHLELLAAALLLALSCTLAGFRGLGRRPD